MTTKDLADLKDAKRLRTVAQDEVQCIGDRERSILQRIEDRERSILQRCDHLLPDGQSAIEGGFAYNYCTICSRLF